MEVETKTMSKKLTLNLVVVTLSALLAISTTALGQQRRNFQSQAASQAANQAGTQSSSNRAQGDAATVFRSARDYITDGDWAKAQAKFSEYVSSYPNEKNLDAALYWLAYAQNKLDRFEDARKTINQLLEKYPSSSWRNDARVLLAQVPGGYKVAYEPYYVTNVEGPVPAAVPAVGQTPLTVYTPSETMVAPAAPIALGQGIGIGAGRAGTIYRVDDLGEPGNDDDPCELKIVVLQALFQADVQRGIMAATEWLKPGSAQTVRCKSAALALLGRHGGQAVTPVILGVARNETDVKLRARAISALGATNDDSVIDALRDFALTSQDNDIVEASLYALSKHTGDRAITVLSDIATSGKTINQRKVAIWSISTRPGEPAVDALFRIYDADQNVEIRKAVVAGFANRKSERAGNKLMEIARSSDNVELRKAAIGAISRRGGDKTIDFLLNLYDSEKNEELKDQILNSLASGSVVIATSGQTLAMPRKMGSVNALSDQRVIQKLIQIAKDQQAPMERRKRAIGWLSRSNDPTVLKFLEELLK
jgi:tetratricopeptide (TPR) repeat protein